MKQLTCEMCGGTDMVKEDGVFVCQNCGMKYSVEEAKKMMIEGIVEVQGAVQVKNVAQLDNLLKLARQSYESKNYAKAEEFCNQILSIDDKNYEVWKIKAEAINMQISYNNPRIDEVFNCFMEAYHSCNNEDRKDKNAELTVALFACLRSEIDFWVQQVEKQRPTEATVTKAKNSYIDSWNKFKKAMEEMEYNEKLAQVFLDDFDNFFIDTVNTVVSSAWESTRLYYFGSDRHPSDEIFRTYIDEIDKLITLLKVAEENYNNTTPLESKLKTYELIIFLHNCAIDARSYNKMLRTTTNGYGAVINREEYYEPHLTLNNETKKIRREEISNYREKHKQAIIYYCKEKTVEEVVELAKDYIKKHNVKRAVVTFDIIIQQNPNEVFGYIGKAICLIENVDPDLNEALKNIIKAKDKNISDKFVKITRDLINSTLTNNYTLLMCAAQESDLHAVVTLLELGADVNIIRKDGHTTALTLASGAQFLSNYGYYEQYDISYEKLPSAREIVRILLEKGADVKLTPNFISKKTDKEITKAILEKFPDIQVKKSGGCYVATAVYGSYDCPPVWTLRRYRDYTLAETWYGRLFIKLYYAISPTLVKWFGKTKWFKRMWQSKLDRMVARLNEEGVESTPYEDKEW